MKITLRRLKDYPHHPVYEVFPYGLLEKAHVWRAYHGTGFECRHVGDFSTKAQALRAIKQL